MMIVPNGISVEDGRLYGIAYQIIKKEPALSKMNSSTRKKWCEGFANGVHFARTNGEYLDREVFKNEDSSKCSDDSLHESQKPSNENAVKPSDKHDGSNPRRRGGKRTKAVCSGVQAVPSEKEQG